MIASLIASIALASAAPTNAELKIGTSGDYDSLNPLVSSSGTTFYVLSSGLRGLVFLDEDGKWQTQLAKEIPSIEKKTAKVITEKGTKKISAVFEILDNAKWGDGAPITCKDFDLAIKVAHSPNVSVGEKNDWVMVERVEWDNKTPKKCNFIFEKAEYTFYQVGKIKPLPSHIEGPIFEKHKNEPLGYEKNSMYTSNPTNKALYNGPYLITEVKLGSHIKLEPNPFFYGKAPKIKKVVIKFIPNTGTLEANLRSGTIDMISEYGLTFDQALAFESKIAAEKLPYRMVYQSAFSFEHAIFNLDNPILASVNVRRALIYGLDRQAMVKALFKGKQQVADYDVNPKDIWYTQDPKFVTLYPFNKAKAIELLTKDGWTPGPDGVRVKNGQRLSIVFMSTAGNKMRENVQTFIQEQWKALGVETIIKNEPPRVFFAETTQKRKFQGLAMFAMVANPERIPFGRNHSVSIPTEANGFSGQNYAGWKNKRVDEILSNTLLEFSAPKRSQSMKEYAKEYTSDVPHIPLYFRSDNLVVPLNLKNYKPTGHVYPPTNSIENWTLE
jgi:peptide/nickel transport system substrate-binding protein